MTLCDLSRVDELTGSDVQALHARLTAAGVTRKALHPISSLCEHLPEPLRHPARRWHLRRVPAPLGPLLRAFFFADPVPEPELRSALFDDHLYNVLSRSGLLIHESGGVVCPLRLNLVNDLLVFTDDLCRGGDAVMGAGTTTATVIQAAWPSRRVGSILDMGCGAGTAALLLSRSADAAVGADISERAITLSKLNARVAGIENVEFLRSDLFSALQSRQFDLIVAQPPFVSCPAGTESITFLHGGSRGDELALRMLQQIPPQLAPGGRAVLLVDWPKYDDVSPTDRIRHAIGDAPIDIMVLLSTPKDLDDHVTFYGSTLHPTLGEDFERYVLSHREHLEHMHIRELRLALIVLRRTKRAPWTRLVETRSLIQVEPTGAQLERLIAVQDLLELDSDSLLSASLVIPPETKFIEQDSKTLRVELPASRLLAPVVTSRAGADLLLEVDRATTVAEAAEAMFQRFPQLQQGGIERVLDGVRGALQSGLLEIGEEQSS